MYVSIFTTLSRSYSSALCRFGIVFAHCDGPDGKKAVVKSAVAALILTVYFRIFFNET